MKEFALSFPHGGEIKVGIKQMCNFTIQFESSSVADQTFKR